MRIVWRLSRVSPEMQAALIKHRGKMSGAVFNRPCGCIYGRTLSFVGEVGQISELINANPKPPSCEEPRISGLYQRRHEAELKLNNTETNLARVEDVLEQLASQLARWQNRPNKRRVIGHRGRASLLKAPCHLLWHEARQKAVEMNGVLREKTLEVARAETAARETEKLRKSPKTRCLLSVKRKRSRSRFCNAFMLNGKAKSRS